MKTKNQIKEPIGIQQPEKLPQIESIPWLDIAKIYPDENATDDIKEDFIEKSPIQISELGENENIENEFFM